MSSTAANIPTGRHVAHSVVRTLAGSTPTSLATSFKRADIVFEDVEHRGPSYEGRVFLNNISANAATPLNVDPSGYAGSFHVFGHGACLGDAGHCEATSRGIAPTDLRDPHPLKPITKIVVATAAVQAILSQSQAISRITVVPIVLTLLAAEKELDVVHFKKVSIRFYG
jgi:hypothetical protein